jgi:hypothetical protein
MKIGFTLLIVVWFLNTSLQAQGLHSNNLLQPNKYGTLNNIPQSNNGSRALEWEEIGYSYAPYNQGWQAPWDSSNYFTYDIYGRLLTDYYMEYQAGQWVNYQYDSFTYNAQGSILVNYSLNFRYSEAILVTNSYNAQNQLVTTYTYSGLLIPYCRHSVTNILMMPMAGY